MLSRVISAAVQGIDASLIQVGIDISPGLPMFSTVGLPDSAVRESKDRVISAIRNSGFDLPTRKVTVNLAPADVKKEGASFDLPIAIGILKRNKIFRVEACPKTGRNHRKVYINCTTGNIVTDFLPKIPCFFI